MILVGLTTLNISDKESAPQNYTGTQVLLILLITTKSLPI